MMTFLRGISGGEVRKLAMISASLLILAGCDEQGEFALFQPGSGAVSEGGGSSSSTRLVERDVEAPDVFQETDQGLWDGRPSLGGVWVAHPNVQDPERVIIRNTANNKFVIGALFRRERENPGPIIQVSSDAAAALGMLAGSPAQLNVTALRRETAAESAPEQDEAMAELPAPDEVETSALDPVAGATAAIEAAELEAATVPTPQPVAAPAPQTSSLDKPFVQIGIFSVEQNAENTATAMRQGGMSATVKKQSASGKPFWRVIVGPAGSSNERASLLKKAQDMGFVDAYTVAN